MEVYRSQFAEDGLSIIKDKNNFIHYSDEHGVQIGEDTAFPGVLAAGVASSNGTVLKSWGAKVKQYGLDRVFVERIGTGQYKVHHSIGHSNYIPTATPFGTSAITITIFDISDYYFTLETYETGGKAKYNSGFTYLCVCGT